MLKLDWAEAGDPPNADYASVRAKPLAKPVRYAPLTREIELELARRWHENRDEKALEWLVGAHRPMVVRMAKHRWRGNGTSLAALVEYGMLGVRLAAEPPRPSESKKGKLVGFDVGSGNRFSTYARHEADKQMRLALADDPKAEPERTAEQEAAVKIAAEAWHMAGSLRGTLDAPAVLLDLQGRRAYFKPHRAWTLWRLTKPQQKPRPRNFIKHPRTQTELDGLDAFHARHWLVLDTNAGLAKSGMEGWDADEEADTDFLVASSSGFRHMLKGKSYRVADKFMRFWWRLGCKKLKRTIKFSKNQGLGVCSRYGELLPDYSFLVQSGGARRRPIWGAFLSLNPLASIYLMRGRNTARFFPQNKRYPPKEHGRWMRRLISAKYFRLGCQWAPSKSWRF
jgi:hypothetical protein